MTRKEIKGIINWHDKQNEKNKWPNSSGKIYMFNGDIIIIENNAIELILKHGRFIKKIDLQIKMPEGSYPWIKIYNYNELFHNFIIT